MKLTKHAEKRMRQRGFPGLAISIIEHYGTPRKARGGAIKVVLNNKGRQDAISEAKHFIQQLEKDYNVDLMDKMNVSYKQGEYIAYKTLIDFKINRYRYSVYLVPLDAARWNYPLSYILNPISSMILRRMYLSPP